MRRSCGDFFGRLERFAIAHDDERAIARGLRARRGDRCPAGSRARASSPPVPRPIGSRLSRKSSIAPSIDRERREDVAASGKREQRRRGRRATSARKRRASCFIRSRRFGRSSGREHRERGVHREHHVDAAAALEGLLGAPARPGEGEPARGPPRTERASRAATARASTARARISARSQLRVASLRSRHARRRYDQSTSSATTSASAGARPQRPRHIGVREIHGSGPRHARAAPRARSRAARRRAASDTVPCSARRCGAHGRPLELIDLLVDALQRGRVHRAEVAAAGGLSRCRAAAASSISTGRYS